MSDWILTAISLTRQFAKLICTEICNRDRQAHRLRPGGSPVRGPVNGLKLTQCLCLAPEHTSRHLDQFLWFFCKLYLRQTTSSNEKYLTTMKKASISTWCIYIQFDNKQWQWNIYNVVFISSLYYMKIIWYIVITHYQSMKATGT